MLEELGRFGAYIAYTVLGLGIMFAAAYPAIVLHNRTGKTWLSWLLGIATFFILILIFGPTLEALERVGCRGADDMQACLDGE